MNRGVDDASHPQFLVTCLVGEDDLTEPLGRRPLQPLGDVGVAVERELHRRVTESLGHDLRTDAGDQGERRSGMPKVVNPDRG